MRNVSSTGKHEFAHSFWEEAELYKNNLQFLQKEGTGSWHNKSGNAF